MLTVSQAAERAAVSESLIRSWISDGTLSHYRLGRKGSRGKIMIAVEDLDGVLAEFKVGKRLEVAAPSPPRPKPVFRHLRA